MKIQKSILFLLVGVSGLLFVGTSAAQKYYKDITYPRLNDIQIPDVERIELSNGIILFLLEDHELPLINLSARFGVGSIDDPIGEIGLASITGEVMRTGGSLTMSGEEMDEALESIAGSVETGIGLTSGSASMSVLKEHLDQGLSILVDVLTHPAFPQDKIDLAKVQLRSVIARRNDQASSIASREFPKLIYGADSPYARHSEYADVDAITREDLIDFHQEFFHPDNCMISVWGDFDAGEMKEMIERAFADWKKSGFERKPFPEVNYEFDSSVNLIKKEDINQTILRLGHIGGLMDNPDYFALEVMSDILGGAFTSRIFKNIRSRMGLAYSAGGSYGSSFAYPGTFFVYSQTKADSTVKALEALIAEIDKMTKELVTDEELAQAKDQYLNSYVFNFDTKGEIVNRMMMYEYYGYPKDFLQKTKENVEKVTKEDVLRVAKKYLHPDWLRILAVGNPELFDRPLSELGEVNEIDITIPVVEEAIPEATDDDRAKGKEFLSKSVEACGGLKAFQAIQSAQITSELNIVTPQGALSAKSTATIVPPDRERVVMNLPMGEILQILNGDKSWLVTPNGAMPAPEQTLKEMQADLRRNLTFFFGRIDQTDFEIQYLGEEKAGEESCEVLHITLKEGGSFKLYLNAETMIPAKIQYRGMSMMGAPADCEEIYSDYRDVCDVKIPFHMILNQDGKETLVSKVQSYVINPEVDDSQFVVEE